jgi:hypothetical protein
MREFQPQGGTGRTAGRSHERRDLQVRNIALFAVTLTAVLFAAHYGLKAVFVGLQERADRMDRPRPPLRSERVIPPEPRLETLNEAELDSLRRAEDRRLGTYGWIDREHRVLRIPIDRAIDQVLRRGLPARAPVREAD